MFSYLFLIYFINLLIIYNYFEYYFIKHDVFDLEYF